jgi:hypothetical protein
MTADAKFHRFKESWQRQLNLAPITYAQHRVGMAISWHLNHNTREAWPGTTTLARAAGCTDRTVIRATQRLERLGLVSIIRGRNGRLRTANHYLPILKMSPPPDRAVSPPPDKAVSVGTDRAMSQEPLREPSKEPLREPLPREAAVYTAATQFVRFDNRYDKEEGAGERREGGEEEFTEATLYQLARRHYGNRGPGLVAKAIRDGLTVPEITHILADCIESDDDPGHALWQP